MPILAGETITAVRLGFRQDGTALTNTAVTAAATFTDWGTETVVFPNPGVSVSVSATLSGNFFDSVAEDVTATCRVGISLDSGATFTFGNVPAGRVGTNVTLVSICGADHVRSGTPSGTVVVKAQVEGDTTNVNGRNGFLRAILLPT